MKKAIIISSVVLALGTGAGLIVTAQNQPEESIKSNAIEAEPVVASAPVVLSEPAPVEEEPAAPAPAQTTQEAPVTTETAPRTAAPKSNPWQWAHIFRRIGIADSDFAYVTEMVLNESGWRVEKTEAYPQLWSQAGSANQGSSGYQQYLTDNLIRANDHVKATHGTWAKAYDVWMTQGDF